MKKKILSIIVALAVIFSSVFVAMSVTADTNLPDYAKEYFVMSGATGGDGTASSPFGNIVDAVNSAKAENYTAADTVKITVLDNEDISDVDVLEWGTWPEYDFNVVLSSATIAAKVNLAAEETFMGNIEFANINIFAGGAWPGRKINFGGHNVKLRADASINSDYIAYGNASGHAVFEEQKVELDGTLSTNPTYIYLSNETNGNVTRNGDVTIKLKSANGVIAPSSNWGTTAFEGNVNLDLTALATCKLQDFGSEGGWTINGAVQIVCTENFTLTNESLLETYAPTGGVYKIINNTGIAELFEFVSGEAGKYKLLVDTAVYDVKVSDGEGNDYPLQTIGEDTYIVLPESGTYTLSVIKNPETRYYYVDPDGIEVTAGIRPDTAGTKENPVKTIADATRLISQDPLNSKDTANVIVPNDKVTQWGTDAVSYAPKLVIQSDNLEVVAKVETTGSTTFTGRTYFKSVNMMQTNGNSGINFGHYDVGLDANSTFSTYYLSLGGVVSPGTVIADQTVEIYGHIYSMELKLAPSYGNTTYENKIHVIIDNSSAAVNIRLGARTETTTNYNGSVLVDIRNASTVSFDNITNDAVVNIGGSIGMIVNKNVRVTQAVKNKFNAIEATGGSWYITNRSEIPDLVSFTEVAGQFAIKDGKKIYVRQYEVEQMDEYESETVTLPSGEWVISDNPMEYLESDGRKMLYFRNSGGLQDLYVRVEVTPGETYRFEYSAWSSRYEDFSPIVRANGDYRWTLTETVKISEEKVDNYYKVVCEATIPEDYEYPTAFFGVELFPFSEGYLFDVSVYAKNDSEKTNIMPNNDLQSGLDYWAVGYEFWGAIFSGPSGAAGALEWDGNTKLKVETFSLDTIQALIDACNPNDGEWWEKDQIKEEKTYVAYAGKVSVIVKDNRGGSVSGYKVVLQSKTRNYSTLTNSNGKFEFKDKIVTDYYTVLIKTPFGKTIDTGCAMFIEEKDELDFELLVNYAALYDESIEDEEDNRGAFSGTVYTPMLETVPNLKVCIKRDGFETKEAVTDEKGYFAFANLPEGEYVLYTVLEDGSEYEFRTVTVSNEVILKVKLKYDPPMQSDTQGIFGGWIIWVIIASIGALLGVGAVAFVIIFKKKKQ